MKKQKGLWIITYKTGDLFDSKLLVLASDVGSACEKALCFIRKKNKRAEIAEVSWSGMIDVF
jgi:hypothetical protein